MLIYVKVSIEDDIFSGTAIYDIPKDYVKDAKKCINRAHEKWRDNPERDFINIWGLVENEFKKQRIPYKDRDFETVELSDY